MKVSVEKLVKELESRGFQVTLTWKDTPVVIVEGIPFLGASWKGVPALKVEGCKDFRLCTLCPAEMDKALCDNMVRISYGK